MSAPRGKGSGRRAPAAEAAAPRSEPSGLVPDLLRRVVGMGVSGLFLGEEVVRKALGESLPRDWVEFAAAQSERTRRELIERMVGELGRTLDRLDVPALVERLLEGHEIEVSARVRLVGRDEGNPSRGERRGRRLRVAMTDAEDEEADR